ncbi:MAG TPA: adenine phosphoribosyltransferase [Acidimicrobiales bacterium]|jgi:adenine phosphoribosyltransferase|nr:adenine phosphoribosyltransferase [Acidimicrobiales bacterium]
MADADWLKGRIRDVADFPSAGIVFRDLTPLLGDAEALRFSVDALAEAFAGRRIDKVVGIEARGFILAAPVAYRLAAGLVPVRKPGKLPWRTEFEEYALEYGFDRLEIHADAVDPGDQVLVIDDVIATGGTARATVGLVERLGATVAGLGFLVELTFLAGREKLEGYDVVSLVSYP